MAYIKNPNYNPLDPKSQRYIEQTMSVAPNQSTVPQVSIPKTPTYTPTSSTATTTKTSTASGLPTTPVAPVAPRISTPVSQSTQNMSVAPKATSSAYTVKSGDTLGAIAARNGTTVQELQRLNPQITNVNLIQPGQVFKLPGAVAPSAPATPSAPPAPQVQPAQSPAPTQPQQPGGNMPASTPTQPGTPPPTGNVQTDTAMKSLAEQAGKAGMTLDEYLDLVNRSNAPTKEESDAIRNKLGIPDLIDDVFSKPEKSTTELYKELYDLGGLSDVKESVKKLDAEIAQKRADLVTATGELYNNPWISQATRQGRLGNLQRIALADIENSIAQKEQYLSLYDQGISEIEKSIVRSQYDTGLESDLSVAKLNYLLTEAERDEAFAQRAVEQRALRYLPDFLENKPKETAEGFTLSEGQARYDANGNLIANRPKTEDATDRASKPLSGEAAKLFNNSLSALDDIEYIRSQVTSQFGSGRLLDQQYKAAEANIVDVIGRLRSGGAITTDEEDRFKDLLPKLWETDTTRLSKLDRLQNLLSGVVESIQPGSTTPKNLDDYYKQADPTTRANIERMIQENPYLTDDDVMELIGFKSVGSGTSQRLGELSERYESGGDPGAIGYDNTGGWSYGAYQLAHNNAQKFVQQSPYAKEFQGLTFNSEAWRNKWKQVAQKDPQNFKEAQKKYIEQTHYTPQVQKVASAGYDLSKYSDVLKDVVWSTAVQHGANNNIVVNALKALGKNADEQSLIRKIYELRWSGGQNFARSTANVKQSVYNRFFGQNGELAAALNKLNIG